MKAAPGSGAVLKPLSLGWGLCSLQCGRGRGGSLSLEVTARGEGAVQGFLWVLSETRAELGFCNCVVFLRCKHLFLLPSHSGRLFMLS